MFSQIYVYPLHASFAAVNAVFTIPYIKFR